MPPRRSVKKASGKREASSQRQAALRAAERAAEKAAEQEELRRWIDENDPLLDKAPTTPIYLHTLFDQMLRHKTFRLPPSSAGGVRQGEQPYDWSRLRRVLDARRADSPRWFIQIREEDLLVGADGLEGVTLDCFVIAEASRPTLAPAEYLVKVHWPYSDIEDNAPERILPIAGQSMCWRRVVKDNGDDVNAFVLVKKDDPTMTSAMSASAFGFGFGAAPPTTASSSLSPTPSVGVAFSFGATTTTTTTTTINNSNNNNNNQGHSNDQPNNSSNATPASASAFGFRFGTPASTPEATVAPVSFGFGTTTHSTSTSTPAAPPATPPPASFSFSSLSGPPIVSTTSVFAPTLQTTAPTPAQDEGAVPVRPLPPSEVLFTLWSKTRVREMARAIRSGSRLVRDDFVLPPSPVSPTPRPFKLVMQNDRKGHLAETSRELLLNRWFAKEEPAVVAITNWLEACPVFDESLTTALQAFRRRYVNQLAKHSTSFAQIVEAYQGIIEQELARIVAIRARAAAAELKQLDRIAELLEAGRLAEKSTFRLLKYYPENDVQRFRPYRKIGGISEMGEYADVCEPPAHENINPFTGKPM